MLTEGHARRAFELLDETGLLAEVLPEIARMKGVEQPPQFHPEGDVWTHTRCCCSNNSTPLPADPGLGRAAARCGQAAHLPPRRPHPLRRPRGGGRGHGRGDLPPLPLLQRRDAADSLARREPHALCRRGAHEGFHAQALLPPGKLSKSIWPCTAWIAWPAAATRHWDFVRERYESMPEETVRPQPLITGRELIAAGYNRARIQGDAARRRGCATGGVRAALRRAF
jgi:poly(A) polymerase